MAEASLDRIHIRDLALRCIVGINDWERHEKQDVLVNITLWADVGRACRTDDIADTVDYKAVKKQVAALVESSSYNLVERLAEAIAQECLGHPLVKRVRVSVDKPGALRSTRSVGVEIERGSDAAAQAG